MFFGVGLIDFILPGHILGAESCLVWAEYIPVVPLGCSARNLLIERASELIALLVASVTISGR